jgi:hypothetical protein
VQARNGSLFPASIVTLYCAYLAYSALVSEPHDYACNGVGRQLTAASASTLAAGAPPAARPRACLASAGGACVAYPAWASHLCQHGRHICTVPTALCMTHSLKCIGWVT